MVGKGLTPARQILKLIVIDAQTRVPVKPGRSFVRGFFIYNLLFGVVANLIISGLFGFPFFFLSSRFVYV